MLSYQKLFSSLVIMSVTLLVSRAGATNGTQGVAAPPTRAPVRPSTGAFHTCTIKMDWKNIDAARKAHEEDWPADLKTLGHVDCQDRQALHNCWAKDCFVGQTTLLNSLIRDQLTPLDKNMNKISGGPFKTYTKTWYPENKFKPDLRVVDADGDMYVSHHAASDPLPECYACQ